MNILVTGGAGYVGSHTVKKLLRSGHRVWVYDNLSYGHRAAAQTAEFVHGDLHEGWKLRELIRTAKIDAVMHFAAFALVGESVLRPDLYYRNNVIGTISLLDAMRDVGVSKIVFSSTTATYGQPDRVPIVETEPQHPINPYGFSKLVVEHALDDYAQAFGLGFAALRYFNAAGASPDGDIGEDHLPESHLIPIVLQAALGQRSHVTVFGEDYPTSDGSCIRDYIHVTDLADAHLLALEKIEPGKGLKLNLGTGNGFSVREVIDACKKITKQEFKVIIGERRPGDPPKLIADSTLAQKMLGWKPQYLGVESIVETAWRWHSTHPLGYNDRGGPLKT